MIRSPLGKKAYWDKWIDYMHSRIFRTLERIKEPPGDPSYEPQ